MRSAQFCLGQVRLQRQQRRFPRREGLVNSVLNAHLSDHKGLARMRATRVAGSAWSPGEVLFSAAHRGPTDGALRSERFAPYANPTAPHAGRHEAAIPARETACLLGR